MNDDRDLREFFARRREWDLQQTPRFRMPCTQPRPRRRMMPAAIAALLLALVAAAYLARPRATAVPAPELTTNPISSWRAPTDFLLRTPGAELTSSVPRLQPDIPRTNEGDRS